MNRRIHSIFALRLFNDCWAMFFLYISIYFYTKYKWTLGSIFMTIALSIKMNILLFLPPLLVILVTLLLFFFFINFIFNLFWDILINLRILIILKVKSIGIPQTILQLGIIFIFQVLVGTPFLIHNYWSYLIRSFDFGREFMYVWTVNLKVSV